MLDNMFEPNIESNIICPKCGWKWIFNDIAYVNNLSEYGMPMSCPKCKHKFKVRRENTKHTHKPTTSNIIVKEAEETKMKILSLMERVERKKDIIREALSPISHNTEITLDNGFKTTSLVCISNGVSTFHIGEDDHCYKMYKEDENGVCSAYETSYIFPEMFNELKKLPNLPPH